MAGSDSSHRHLHTITMKHSNILRFPEHLVIDHKDECLECLLGLHCGVLRRGRRVAQKDTEHSMYANQVGWHLQCLAGPATAPASPTQHFSAATQCCNVREGSDDPVKTWLHDQSIVPASWAETHVSCIVNTHKHRWEQLKSDWECAD